MIYYCCTFGSTPQEELQKIFRLPYKCVSAGLSPAQFSESGKAWRRLSPKQIWEALHKPTIVKPIPSPLPQTPKPYTQH